MPRYLALGDSYTIGEAVPAPETWPHRVVAALSSEGDPPWSVQVIAVTGWTVAELDEGIDAADPQGPFDMVSLLIGVNDQYRGGTPDAYAPAFAAMLERAIGFAGGDPKKVFVVSIPDYGITPFAAQLEPARRAAIGPTLAAFNGIAAEQSAARGVAFADITPTSLENTPGDVASDGLHPSGTHYARWADVILPVVRTLALETP